MTTPGTNFAYKQNITSFAMKTQLFFLRESTEQQDFWLLSSNYRTLKWLTRRV